MKRGPRYLANVIAQGSARFGYMASTMLVYVICARSLGPEVFGIFSYVMAFMAIVGMFAELGTSFVLTRELTARRHDDSASAYFGNFILVRIVLGVATAFGASFAARFMGGADGVLLVTGAFLAPIGAARFIEPVFQIFDQPWRSIPVALITNGVYLIASLAVIFLSSAPVFPLIMVYGLTGATYVAAAFWMSRDLVTPRLSWDPAMFRGIVALSLPIGISTIFAAANGRIGTLLLAQLDSSVAVGRFAAAARLIEVGGVVAVTLATPLLPILTAASARPGGLRTTAQSILEILATVSGPVVTVVSFLSPWLVTRIFGPDYADAGPIAEILSWQLILVPFSIVGSAIMMAAGSVKFGYWNAALATIVNVALVLGLVPMIGARGAAIASVASECSMVFVVLRYMRRDVGQIFIPRTWLKILLLNIAFFAALHFPVLGNPVANGAAAILGYAAIVFLVGILPRRQLAMLFSRAAAEYR